MDAGVLYQAYKEKNYNKFLELFDEYLKEGLGVDIPIINTYIISLTKLRKYEEAARVLKIYEKEIIRDHAINAVLNSYIRCFKVEEAERITRDYNMENIDPLNLVNLYLLEGKIEEAKLETKIIRKNYKLDEAKKERLNKFEKIIYNYENKNGLIETEYNCFLKSGNELEEGHIVFLKKKPEVDERADHDTRALNRSYMIWRIEGEKLYLFPVSGVCREGFRLFHQKYPNSIGDRVIKNNTCISYKENVLSVKDKVLEDDYKLVLRNVYDSLYFGQKQYQEMNEEFINWYVKKPERYDIIETAEKAILTHRFFFTLDVTDENIYAIEIDYSKGIVIGDEVVIFKKDELFFDVIEINENTIDEYKELSSIKRIGLRR